QWDFLPPRFLSAYKDTHNCFQRTKKADILNTYHPHTDDYSTPCTSIPATPPIHPSSMRSLTPILSLLALTATAQNITSTLTITPNCATAPHNTSVPMTEYTHPTFAPAPACNNNGNKTTNKPSKTKTTSHSKSKSKSTTAETDSLTRDNMGTLGSATASETMTTTGMGMLSSVASGTVTGVPQFTGAAAAVGRDWDVWGVGFGALAMVV
ncbi:hypothetical protein BDW02DRAFT_612140, partial [Decorospora gaudefroyi]